MLSTDWSDLSGVMIQEDFAVTNVKSILLSLGKLLKKGWHLEKMNQDNASNSNNQHQNSQATMQLTSPHLVEIMEFLCSIEGTVWQYGAKSAKSRLRIKKPRYVRSLLSCLKIWFKLNWRNGHYLKVTEFMDLFSGKAQLRSTWILATGCMHGRTAQR